MKKAGSSRFSTRTGGDSDVFLDKSSKKDKLRRLSCVGIVGEMDQLSHSISTNSTTKRVNLPNKFSDHSDTINHATAPRKQRSAMKKREHESASTMLPGSRNEIGVPSKDCRKKHRTAADDYEDSKVPSRDSVLTKDEEEVAEALFAMARACNSGLNGTSELEPSSIPGSPVPRESYKHIESTNEAEDTNVITDVKKSRERCSVHIYICHFIKSLQTTENKDLGTDVGSKQEACLNKVEGSCNGLFQEQQQAFDAANRPKTMREEDTPTQLQDLMGLHLTNPENHHLAPTAKQMLPYLSTMEHDHHRWTPKTLSKQQSWGNQTGCSVETFGLKYTQGSLLQVVGSEHGLNKGKMQLSSGSSGYEKRSLFFVDSGPTLELTL